MSVSMISLERVTLASCSPRNRAERETLSAQLQGSAQVSMQATSFKFLCLHRKRFDWAED